MGFGDELMLTGLAKGARVRGQRIAAGDGKTIIWGPWCEQVFRNNPNIAPPGAEGAPDLIWIAHYKGHRLYVKHHGARWIFDRSFRVTPGEMFFDRAELDAAATIEPGFVLIEPRVKPVYPNKQWPVDRYAQVAACLTGLGFAVRQFQYGAAGPALRGVDVIRTASFRDGLAALSRAALYIGPEGGLSHGAAAVGVPAVVIFGGFPDPKVTGYPHHVNLTGGVEPCGSVRPCGHCKIAMMKITVDVVVAQAKRILNAGTVRDNCSVGECRSLDAGC